eukprot:1160911-Pelagomonas_calceolata.AAC.15
MQITTETSNSEVHGENVQQTIKLQSCLSKCEWPSVLHSKKNKDKAGEKALKDKGWHAILLVFQGHLAVTMHCAGSQRASSFRHCAPKLPIKPSLLLLQQEMILHNPPSHPPSLRVNKSIKELPLQTRITGSVAWLGAQKRSGGYVDKRCTAFASSSDATIALKAQEQEVHVVRTYVTPMMKTGAEAPAAVPWAQEWTELPGANRLYCCLCLASQNSPEKQVV